MRFLILLTLVTDISALYQLDILQPEDIASAIAYCVSQPERVSINEILIRPTQQAN